MTGTATVCARVEPEVKEQAEHILTELGIPMSDAISMFLKAVVIQGGLPFEAKSQKPLSLESMAKAQLEAKIQKGMDDIKSGNVYPAEEVEAKMEQYFKS